MVELSENAEVRCNLCGKAYTVNKRDFCKICIEHEYDLVQDPAVPVGTSYVWSWRKACVCGSMIEFQADAWEHPLGAISTTHQYIGMEETAFNGDAATIVRKFDIKVNDRLAEAMVLFPDVESHAEEQQWEDFYLNYRGT